MSIVDKILLFLLSPVGIITIAALTVMLVAWFFDSIGLGFLVVLGMLLSFIILFIYEHLSNVNDI